MADITHGGGHVAEHHDHPPHLQHHFDTPVQQFDAGKLGMWLFLSTEILLFGGLFCAYAVYRRNHPEIFEAGHVHLDKFWGGVNTCVLLISSFTMAYAVYCSQTGRQTGLKIGLFLTLLGGFGFMGIKYVEYRAKFEHGLLWGKRYNPTEHAAHAPDAIGATTAPHADGHAPPSAAEQHAAAPAAQPPSAAAPPAAAAAAPPTSNPALLPIEPSTVKLAATAPPGLRPRPTHAQHSAEEHANNVHIFFSIYFAMTGLHGLHVVAGMAVITWLLVKANQGAFSPEYFTPVDLGGLYWHLVDLIWIFLFPLLYLIH